LSAAEAEAEAEAAEAEAEGETGKEGPPSGLKPGAVAAALKEAGEEDEEEDGLVLA